MNKQILINDWNGHGPTWQQGSIYLTGGQKYDIVMDFADFGGGAKAQLLWEYYGQYAQIVPSCRLYPLISSPPSNPLALVDRRVYTVEVDDVYITFDIDMGQVIYVDGNTASYSDNYSGEQTYVSDNTYDGSAGGNVPGGATSTTSPDFDAQYASAKAVMLSAFYAAMAQKRILFSESEKSVIGEFYPTLMNNIKAYVDQYGYGQKPNGKNAYQMSAADQRAYPKFANLIQNNIRDYVMNNAKILNALKTFSGLSEQKIRAILGLNNIGPTIVVEQLAHPDVWGEQGYVYGQFDADDNPNIIKVDKLTLIRYEESGLLWPELESAYFTLLAQTLVHELSHYGANLTQTIDYTDGQASTPNGGTYTHRFDIAAFGYPNVGSEVMRRKYILKRAP